jgi:hypothetical protein
VAHALLEVVQIAEHLPQFGHRPGFPPDDRILAMVVQARNAMHNLRVAVHYTGCRGQVSRGSRWPRSCPGISYDL